MIPPPPRLSPPQTWGEVIQKSAGTLGWGPRMIGIREPGVPLAGSKALGSCILSPTGVQQN